MSTTKKLTQKRRNWLLSRLPLRLGCLPCTMYRIKAVREAGASEAEVLGAIGIALHVRENGTEMVAEATQGKLNYEYPCNRQSSSLKQPLHNMAAIGAALACNSAAGSEYYLTTARMAGASTHQIQTAIGIARAIRKEAEEKADMTIGMLTKSTEVEVKKQNDSIVPLCHCG